jgi:8-oxo-dGTP diphosphatase
VHSLLVDMSPDGFDTGAGRRISEAGVGVCVGALIIRDGCVLLGRRSAHKSFAGCWDIPGGHVEAGEAIEDAMRRELDEELGIVPTAWAFHSRHADRQFELYLFMVTQWSGQLRARGDEHADLRWHDLGVACNVPDLSSPRLGDVLRSLVDGRATPGGSPDA